MEMSSEESRKWDAIVSVHNRTKALILLAEELNREHEFFWPPLIQQRDALDHVVRAQRVVLHPNDLPREKGNAKAYVVQQLDKALGHIYRAYFDVADWFSLVLRENICEYVNLYSRDVVCAVVPSLGHIDSRLDGISRTIAQLRAGKDIAVVDEPESDEPIGKYASDMDMYEDVIRELEVMWRALLDARDALENARNGASQ